VRFAARARTVTPIKGVLKKPEVVIPVWVCLISPWLAICSFKPASASKSSQVITDAEYEAELFG
jgi:hypothetical protein